MCLARALRLLRLLGVLDPPEARKVSFLATPSMSTVDATHLQGRRHNASADR